jgi:hypothetical protein
METGQKKAKKPIFKRWWFWVLAVLVVLSIPAALSQGDKEASATPSAASSPASPSPQGADAAEDELSVEEPEPATPEPAPEVSISEKVLLDEGGIKITATGLSKSFMGNSVELLIENNSDAPVTVHVDDVSVNGFMFEPLFSCSVASGKKANDSINLYDDDLEAAQISLIKDLELKFKFLDPDTYATFFVSGAIAFETDGSESYQQSYDDSGVLLMDQNGVKATIKKLDSQDSFWGADLYLYIENGSGGNIVMDADECSINGFMVNPIFSCSIVDGKKAVDTITFLQSELEENGITEIKEIELVLTCRNPENFQSIFSTEPIVAAFN